VTIIIIIIRVRIHIFPHVENTQCYLLSVLVFSL